MVKEELKNTIKLTKVKLRSDKKSFIILAAIMVCMLIMNLLSCIALFKRSDIPVIVSLQDYSTSFMFFMIIGFVVLETLYKSNTSYFSVYPQTNNSRFLSTRLTGYLFVTAIAIAALIMYFIQLAVVKTISAFHAGITITPFFNMKFAIVGFFVYLSYLFLAYSFISLIGVLIRKFRLYAIIVVSICFVILISNLSWASENIPKLLGFLTHEDSVILFFIKSILLTISFNFISLIINRYTLYYKSRNSYPKKYVYIVFPLLIVFTIITTSYESTSSFSTSSSSDDIIDISQTITIDTSRLKKGSVLDVIPNENISIPQNGVQHYDGFHMVYDNNQTIKINSNTLKISYDFPINIDNGIDLLEFIHPKFNAELKNNKLYLKYSYTKNVKIVALPIWSLAKQFKYFSNKGVLMDGIYHSAGGGGNITIDSE